MSTVDQTQDYQGAYSSTIKTVWYLIALSFVLSFIGAVKISYVYNGDVLPFVVPNFSFIMTVMSATTTVGCFIGERAISRDLPNLKTDDEILIYIKDVNFMRGLTIISLMAFLLLFAFTPVSSFVPILLNDRTSLVIFACVPLSLALATMWLKTAITIQQKYLKPQ